MLIQWYAGKESITFAEFNKTLAGIPLIILGFYLILDYMMDTGSLYRKVWGRQKGFSGLMTAMGTAGMFFLVMTWLMAGAITLNFASISPVVLVVAMFLTLLLLWPKTGTMELGFWMWLAANVVTHFQYFQLIPKLVFGG
ncbi:hypothetical protein [Thermococcus sp. 9N3]|uniref:hypothetical protein n=1 Tax=Thermococcus sp. 9N3 TaxID=163002 RepID=UPI001430945F|nr:hypothetical protein [Thermococcus sp. 9N3]NJE48411.1 hypothetical protein [Thermococcus sp. 9N3]